MPHYNMYCWNKHCLSVTVRGKRSRYLAHWNLSIIEIKYKMFTRNNFFQSNINCFILQLHISSLISSPLFDLIIQHN